MTITLYTFEDADGNEVGSYSTQSGPDAKDYARQYGYNVKANEYEFADSYLVGGWCFANAEAKRATIVPEDFPVRPLTAEEIPHAGDAVTCEECGLTWDDSITTSMTPAPSARCPFEYFHYNEEG